MNCDCYKVRYLPLIERLEKVSGLMYYSMKEYDQYQQQLHDIILSMNMNFRCIDKCELKE
ncbi:unnamed protein product [marine sediment metagenome]|uniref:Uncharacterized protein n=1 Tax=marine sediment metagenome TaxID=412755 RepID=X1JFD6_9ZZZZ